MLQTPRPPWRWFWIRREPARQYAKNHKDTKFINFQSRYSGDLVKSFWQNTWTVRQYSQAFRKNGQIPFIYCQLPRRWMNRVSFSQFHNASLPQISCSPLWQVVPTTVHFKCRFVTKLKDENLEEVTSESTTRILWILQWWSSLCTLNWFVGWKLDFHELRAHGVCFLNVLFRVHTTWDVGCWWSLCNIVELGLDIFRLFRQFQIEVTTNKRCCCLPFARVKYGHFWWLQLRDWAQIRLTLHEPRTKEFWHPARGLMQHDQHEQWQNELWIDKHIVYHNIIQGCIVLLFKIEGMYSESRSQPFAFQPPDTKDHYEDTELWTPGEWQHLPAFCKMTNDL